MDATYDYKRFAILYVDDEEKALKYFKKAFEPHFRILTATNAADGFRILQEHRDAVAVLMTDQRMPGEQGVQLLERARQLRPRILRILATAYSDINAAIDAVNTGAIYKYITKPWKIPELEMTLRRGLEFFMVQQERDQLLKEKLGMIQNLIIADRLASLGILASGLNHHLRNSLVAIRTFLDLAPAKLREEEVDLERLKNPGFWKEFHDHVQTQVSRITDMLSEIGGTAQRSNFAFQTQVDLAEIIARAADTLKERLEQKRVVLDTRFPSSLPLLRVDRWKFQRLFELLLNNELLNVPEGSRISCRARALPGGSAPNWAVELEIHDESRGLPAEAFQSMFDPFLLHTSRDAEFGINLLTCCFIVCHHGGKIEVKANEGQGLTYRLAFPADPQISTAAPEEQSFLAKVLLNESLWEKLLTGA
ncbi:MAG: response regulator [Verrucomicrobia bacterium]|nr:response regulator [Verrucomicrobiota bacterium]